MYRVLARKWRPRTFEELVGQRHVTRALSNAIESGRLAHAYIFAGQRGTGKTTVARIFATCLNVEDGPTATPDPESPVAKEIAESRSIDVLELDAASRTSVDNIRELQEVISYAPARDRYKVLIIDEAHMLSKAAFNALLKTLEEPPPNVIFVLATTELQKLLPTILSRCQVFEFRRVRTAETAAYLRKLADAEGMTISDHALERVARAGDGSVRDALSVLERVLAFCGMEAGDEDVLRVLGVVDREVLVAFVAALAARDAGAMLAVLDGLVDEGHDLHHFWAELLGVMRDLLRARVGGDDSAGTRPASEVAELREAAGELSRQDLTRAFQLLADLEPALRSSGQPRFLFESAAIRLCDLGSVRPIEELLAGGPPTDVGPGPGSGPGSGGTRRPAPRRPRAGAGADASAPASAGASAASPAAAEAAPVQPVETARDAPAPPTDGAPSSREPETHAEPGADTVPAPGGPPLTPEDVLQRLGSRLQESNPMLATILAGCAGHRLDEERLTLRFPSEQRALARQLERDTNLSALRSALSGLENRSWRVDVEVAQPAVAAEGAGPTGPAAERKALMEAARNEPGVRKLLLEFGAQILEVQPLEDEGVGGPAALEESP